MVSSLEIPPLNINYLLKKYGLSPKKGLGQNFLVDPIAIERIIRAAEIPEGGMILEIGPGLGSLTRYLAARANTVIAVELDTNLIPALEEILENYGNVHLVQGDILKINLSALLDNIMGSQEPGITDDYLVVANIPYNITSHLIRRLLEIPRKPSRLVLTIQREVADRICAKPGELSLLALGVQVYGKPTRVLRIPAGSFFPVPKVDSATLRIDLYQQPLIPDQNLETFFSLAKAGFQQKRKNLRNSLASAPGLNQESSGSLLSTAGIDPTRRAQSLSLEEWNMLVECYLRSR